MRHPGALSSREQGFLSGRVCIGPRGAQEEPLGTRYFRGGNVLCVQRPVPMAVCSEGLIPCMAGNTVQYLSSFALTRIARTPRKRKLQGREPAKMKNPSSSLVGQLGLGSRPRLDRHPRRPAAARILKATLWGPRQHAQRRGDSFLGRYGPSSVSAGLYG